MAVLMPQWQMALELNRPMSLHCRKAFDAMFGLANELGLPSKGAVIHAFSGSAEQAMVAIRHGFYISFCCSLMNPKNKRIRKALLSVPLERLLLETDSPDISPVKDQLNEPSNLAHLFKAVTELLETTPEKLEKQLQDNTGRVFGTLLNFVS
jgi:TatD DNase family protein